MGDGFSRPGRRGVLAGAAVATLAGATRGVRAQPAAAFVPSRPVVLVVSNPAGGTNDFTARLVAEPLSQRLGVPVVVENRPGGNGVVGTQYAARARPDGHTLDVAPTGAFAVAPHLFSPLPYDNKRAFAPISLLASNAMFVCVHPASGIGSYADLIARAKAQPGKLSYGHAGVGTSQHLGAELFKYMAHIDIAPVPYRGTTALMPDLLANRITMSFANIVNVVPLAREGKLRALAITSIKRSVLAPDLPTMAESGFPGFEAVPWFGLLAPSGTPKDILDKLHGETVKTLAMPEVRKKFDELGLEPVGNTPAEFAAIIRKETPEWAKVIKDAGIKLGN